tara:strand:- start:3511 stop:3807 length:297 start_codon:yes stop_codon:yes gene_type:complete
MSTLIKEKKKRKIAYFNENTQLILKSIVYNEKLVSSVRWNAALLLFDSLKTGSKTKINNKCILTKRSTGVNSRLRISRIMFKRLASKGLISGLKKNIW